MFWMFEAGSNEFMRLKVQNLCYWHPPWLPDTPGKSQMFLKIKSSIFFKSHLNSRSGTVGTKELWISFHSWIFFLHKQTRAWKSSQNREALEGVVPFKVFGFDSQIVRPMPYWYALFQNSQDKHQKDVEWDFQGKRYFIYFLGKIDAISSDYSTRWMVCVV